MRRRPTGPAGELPWTDGFTGAGRHDWAMVRFLTDIETDVVRGYRTPDGSWTRDPP